MLGTLHGEIIRVSEQEQAVYVIGGPLTVCRLSAAVVGSAAKTNRRHTRTRQARGERKSEWMTLECHVKVEKRGHEHGYMCLT